MEGLAAAGSAIAVVQIAAEISKLCGGYIRDVNHARGDIQRMESKLSALCGVLEKLEETPQMQNNHAAIIQCGNDLRSIKEKLEPSTKHKAMKRFGVRALKWPLTSKEVDEKVKMLEGHLLIFNTALHLEIGTKMNDAEEERSMKKLAYVSDAPFNSYENQRHRPCLENTRVEVLKDIVQWATDASPQCILWLKGMAGTGKSTVAISVASRLRRISKCLATFFFRRGFGDLAHARKLIPTIVRQFSLSSPAYRRLVLATIKAEPDLGQSVNLRDQYEKLILEPLRTLQSSATTPDLFFVVVDALDECDEEKDLRLLLRLLATTKDMPNLHLRVVVTSRPEWVIRQGFEDMPSILYQDLVLHDVPRQIVDHDIEVFLRHELELVQRDRGLALPWPKDSSIAVLVSKAAGLFIFAATACRYIGDSLLANPQQRLEQVCSLVARNHLMTEELDQMYTIVLQNATRGKYTKDEWKQIASRFGRVVGSIVMLLTPLSITELYRLLHDAQIFDRSQLEDALRPLHAVIDVPKDASCSVQPLHLSFRDFLLDHDRCLDAQFQLNEQQTHQQLAWDCVRLLSSFLHRNMCHLPSSSTMVTEVSQSDIDQALPPAVQYGCRYWVAHARDGRVEVLDDGRIHKFLQRHFLHWLEAMSLTGKMSEAIVAVLDLADLVDAQKAPVLFDFVYDCRRFLLAFRHVMARVPEQVYESALFFSPLQSTIRKTFQHLIPMSPILKPPVQERWSASLQSLEGHSDWVNTLVFSPDGKLMASGSDDNTVRLWDVQTGEIRAVLNGHSDWVNTVVFSPDGKLVASESSDNTVRLWDVQTGDIRDVINGYSDRVLTVVFSPDGKLVALGSHNNTVRLWNMHTGDIFAILNGHSESVTTAVFSPDGKLVASGSNDNTVRLWNMQTGNIRAVLNGHSSWVYTVVFSPDGKLVASGSNDTTVRLWNVYTGDIRAVLNGHSSFVTTVVFSPNGKLVASGSLDKIVRLWDVQTGDIRAILNGHSDTVPTVVFSPNGKLLASGSSDRTIRLWDIQMSDIRAVSSNLGHSTWVTTVVFSSNGELVVSGSQDKTVRLWDVQTGDVRVLDGHSDWVSTVAFSLDGKLIASGSVDKTVRLWDVQTGDVRVLDGHSDWVSTVVFSPNGKLVASGSGDKTVRLWDVQTGDVRVLDGHYNWVSTVVFSPDGKLVAAGSYDKTVRLWDVQTGDVRVLDGHSDWVSTVVFSPNGKLVASGSGDKTVRLWDTQKAKLSVIISLSHTPKQLAFHPDPDLLTIDGEAFSVRSGTPTAMSAAQKPDNASKPMICASGEWVLKSSRRALWLPPEYRPSSQASYGNKVVFGYSDGRVSFLSWDN